MPLRAGCQASPCPTHLLQSCLSPSPHQPRAQNWFGCIWFPQPGLSPRLPRTTPGVEGTGCGLEKPGLHGHLLLTAGHGRPF